MDQLITDAKSLVGYTQGHHNARGGYWQQAYGVSDKDQGFAATVDAGERTRDVLSAVYASVVATEKIGAASLLAVEKIGAANTLATQLGFKDAAMQIAECCCKLEARMLEIESNRVRDDLDQARAEIIALRAGAVITRT